jgi:hypothetical protein
MELEEKVADKALASKIEELEELYSQGYPVPDVSQIQFIQVSKSHVN